MLPSLQYKLKCMGYHGIFSAAKRTAADGLPAGVAVITPSYITITAPPLLKDPEIVPSRAVAAQ
eukprot:550419-Pyramimonas_sp.AAC.1